MPAPHSTQRQIDKANALHAQVYGKAEEKPADPTPTDVDVINSLPGAEPVAEPVEPVVEPEPEPVIEPEGGDPSPAAPVEAAGTTDEEDDKFEQRYKVLQGKYNAEVPVLNTQVRDLQTEIVSMRALLTSLENIEPVANQPGDKLLKDEEVEDYGADMIDVVKRAAREELMPTLNRLEEENTQLRAALGGMSQSVTENARDTLYRALNIEIPNWNEINQDSGFLEWLEGVDPYSGIRKGDMLTQAFNDNDSARVVAFFKGYLSENVLVSNNTAPASTAPIEPKVDLVSMAAPGTHHSSPAPSAHADKRVYSQADIARFYRNVQTGMYKNNMAEKEAIERDILLAGPEGRLVK